MEKRMPDRAKLPHGIAGGLIAIAVVGAVAAQHLGVGPWIGAFHTIITAGLIACFLGAAWAIQSRAHAATTAIAAFMLVTNAAFCVAVFSGHNPLPIAPYGSGGYNAVLTVASLVGVVGLLRRQLWARWVCMGLGGAGALGGAMNAANFWGVSGTPNPEFPAWFAQMQQSEWGYLVASLGGSLIVLCLLAAAPRFAEPGVWSDPSPLVRWLRWAIIAAFTAVPILTVYFAVQPAAAPTRWAALLLAFGLVAANILLYRGKAVGALLLLLCGGGLAALSVATLLLAESPRQATYYVVFWAPAAAIALIAGAGCIRPAWRLLRAG